MTPGLSKDLREFVALLVEKDIEFLVVGSYALAFHGHPRYTKDIDFYVRSSRENAQKLELLIREFGFASTGLKEEDFYDPDIVIQLGMEPNRIHLLTNIEGVTFDEAWANRIPSELDGLPASFISKDDLIKNKTACGRPQDLVDVNVLMEGA